MRRSVERELLVWVLGALSLGALLVALVVYVVTLDEMNEIFDVDLKNIATALAGYDAAQRTDRVEPNRQGPAPRNTPGESGSVTSAWSLAGERRYGSDPQAEVPLVRTAGLSRQRHGSEDWIVYAVPTTNGWVQAAQRMSARRETARESATKVMPPLVALVLIIGGLLSFALRRGLRPLDAAARSVAERSARALTPIATSDVPVEVEPMVQSINGLIARLSVAFAAQRRFLADAAHELRTPITALRLQLQLLEGSRSEFERHEALTELKAGVDRSQRLIGQFLAISGAEAEGVAKPMERLDLGELARSVVADLSSAAERAGIDIGASGTASVGLNGHRHELVVLLTNLIENALRYTPEGGVVDVETRFDGPAPLLKVIDNGPGIAVSERERVFERLYRGEKAAELARDSSGAGLGLAIVRAIAERHHAWVSLHTAPNGAGLEVRVRFEPPSGQEMSVGNVESRSFRRIDRRRFGLGADA
jgi:signal transduction histidine kinase